MKAEVVSGIAKIPRLAMERAAGAAATRRSWIGTGSVRWSNPQAPCPIPDGVRIISWCATAPATLAAACPVYLKSHSMGEFVFDHGWSDAAERAGIRYFPKLLVGVPFTPHTGQRFLVRPGYDRAELIEALGQALIALCGRNRLSSVHVNFCAQDEAAVLSGLGFMERLGYQYHWRNADYSSFDDYLAHLKSKRRYAVRHERAALDGQQIVIRVFTGDDIPDDLLPAMYALYQTTIDKLYWGRQYLTSKFFETDARLQAPSVPGVRVQGRPADRGHLQSAKGGRDVRALLGGLSRAQVPALQRLLLRRDRALHQ